MVGGGVVVETVGFWAIAGAFVLSGAAVSGAALLAFVSGAVTWSAGASAAGASAALPFDDGVV